MFEVYLYGACILSSLVIIVWVLHAAAELVHWKWQWLNDVEEPEPLVELLTYGTLIPSPGLTIALSFCYMLYGIVGSIFWPVALPLAIAEIGFRILRRRIRARRQSHV